MSPRIKLFHAPRTRAFTTMWLLEELGEPYERESFPLSSGRHKQADYLALNPMGKVPLVVDNGVPVAETGAIAIYLADRYPANGLAPAVDSPLRPDYLRWILFSAAILEPAYAQRFLGFEISPSNAAWGSFDQALAAANAGVSDREWLLGDTFTAADVVMGSGLGFGVEFGIIPADTPVGAYVKRCQARDAYRRAEEIEDAVGAQYPMEEG